MKYRLCLLATLALVANLANAPAKAADTAIPAAMACDAALIQGEHLSVAVTGQGPDVVLIPGLSTPRAVWDATVQQLKGQYRVHAVQVHGFGDDAGANADGPVLAPMADELTAYIGQCITGKGRAAPAIIGHSLGGLTALMLAAHAPGTVGKAMIVDALPYVGTIFVPGATVEMLEPQAKVMAAQMRSHYGKPQPAPAAADPGPNSMAGGMAATVAGRTQVAAWMRAADPRVTAQLFYDDMTTDMRSELGKITAPVTVLHAYEPAMGDAAKVTQTFEAAYAGTPHVTTHMVTDSRHFIMLDQPEAFAKAVTAFLAQH